MFLSALLGGLPGSEQGSLELLSQGATVNIGIMTLNEINANESYEVPKPKHDMGISH